jgi:hypothetical protein
MRPDPSNKLTWHFPFLPEKSASLIVLSPKLGVKKILNAPKTRCIEPKQGITAVPGRHRQVILLCVSDTRTARLLEKSHNAPR